MKGAGGRDYGSNSRDRVGLATTRPLPLNHGNKGLTTPALHRTEHLHLDPRTTSRQFSLFFSCTSRNLLGFIPCVCLRSIPEETKQEFHLRQRLSPSPGTFCQRRRPHCNPGVTSLVTGGGLPPTGSSSCPRSHPTVTQTAQGLSAGTTPDEGEGSHPSDITPHPTSCIAGSRRTGPSQHGELPVKLHPLCPNR